MGILFVLPMVVKAVEHQVHPILHGIHQVTCGYTFPHPQPLWSCPVLGSLSLSNSHSLCHRPSLEMESAPGPALQELA